MSCQRALPAPSTHCLLTHACSDYAQVSNTTRAHIDVLQQRWLQPQIVLLDVGMVGGGGVPCSLNVSTHNAHACAACAGRMDTHKTHYVCAV